MKKETCSGCGAMATVVRGDYRYVESGLNNVILLGIEIIRCPKCGNEDPIIPRIAGLHRALAYAVASQPFRLQGEDVRFLRKYVAMTQAEFAGLLHVHKSNLSKWEHNEDKIGDQSDRLIRAVAIALGEGLQKKIGEVVKSFPEIRQSARRRIELNVEDYSWKVA